jgi:hypothetical protein
MLDATMWLSVIGVIAFVGALWGPAELRVALGWVVAVMAVASGLHAIARPALLRWANPARPLELPDRTQALLAGTAVTSIAVATGTIGGGGEESDDVRLRVGSQVLLAPALAQVEPRRLAALALTAPRADRGSVAPAVLFLGLAVLVGRDGSLRGAATAGVLAGLFVALGGRHAWTGRAPDEAVLERVGADAVLFAFLLLGRATAARSARTDPEHAEDVWRRWVEGARSSAEQTDGLTAAAVVAELAHLPDLAD